MKPGKVFLDTGIYIAVLNKRDPSAQLGQVPVPHLNANRRCRQNEGNKRSALVGTWLAGLALTVPAPSSPRRILHVHHLCSLGQISQVGRRVD